MQHIPVLLNEATRGLAIKESGIYIDATFGRGGHSKAILECLGPNGRLMAIDKDPEAIATAKKAPFLHDSRFCIEPGSFANLESLVKKQGWEGRVDGILLDLGVSSPQLDDPKRGFSFLREGPLDMRMDTLTGIDAKTWLNQVEEPELIRVLRDYGEERFAKRIARMIITERLHRPIESTIQLAEVIAAAVPKREPGKNPATRSFQAIRIMVNNELEDLASCLSQCVRVLAGGGRICVISFHSLEDKIVKQFIQEQSQDLNYPEGLPVKAQDLKPLLKKMGGLIRPTDEEVENNPRARSSRLRIAEKMEWGNKK